MFFVNYKYDSKEVLIILPTPLAVSTIATGEPSAKVKGVVGGCPRES